VQCAFAGTHWAYPRKDGQAESTWTTGYISRWFTHLLTMVNQCPSCYLLPTQRQRTLTTALFDYISAGRSTHCAFYHWWPLVVPRTVHSTIGDRTFPATAASVWNSLPESVRSSPSLQVFRSRLKTELFAWSGLTVMTNNVSLRWLLLRDFTV